MITYVTIKNCYSFLDASVALSPFTLLIGANGSGKSNFLRLLNEISHMCPGSRYPCFPLHQGCSGECQSLGVWDDKGDVLFVGKDGYPKQKRIFNARVFELDPYIVSMSEPLMYGDTDVQHNGSGVVGMFGNFKRSNSELLQKIKSVIAECVPHVETLNVDIGSDDKVKLRIKEKDSKQFVELIHSPDGVRLFLILIAILYQKDPPSLICIEGIGRGLHPWLLDKLIQLCFDVTHRKENPLQIIAATHNPYVVDQFKGSEGAVVIVEKEKGESKLVTLEERLKSLDPRDEPLGSLWYSGFVGG